jgi:hypothetical protein
LSAVIAEEFTTSPERHPGLSAVCGWLEKIIHGRTAEAILEAPETIPETGGIAVLPVWAWHTPLIAVGRKGRAFGTGDELLMPIRTSWDRGAVVLVDAAASSMDASYRSKGMGHTFAGQTKLVSRPGCGLLAAPEELPSLADPVFVGSGNRRRLITALEGLVEAGRAARWSLLMDIEPRLRKQIDKTHAWVCHEISLTTGNDQALLDTVGREEMLNSMLLGNPSDKRRCSVDRLIDLCLSPDTFLKVDPLKYMATHLKRDAEQELRNRIGDPHIGPKVRKVARQHPRASIDQIIEEYRKIYPKDRLARDRTEAALSVSPDAMARTTQLFPDTMTGHSAIGLADAA